MQPSRAEIYIDTRTRKDGSIVTKKAAILIVRILIFISILFLCFAQIASWGVVHGRWGFCFLEP